MGMRQSLGGLPVERRGRATGRSVLDENAPWSAIVIGSPPLESLPPSKVSSGSRE